jgi:hypothetical protein
MAKKKQPSTLANQLNAELAAGSAVTQGMAHLPEQTPREKLGDMVKRLNAEKGQNWTQNWGDTLAGGAPTQSYKRDKTQAYEVSKTMAMSAPISKPNAPGGKPARMRNMPTANRPQAQSPVSMRGGKAPSGQLGHSLVHSTIKAMELLGEHQGNNKKVIESLVNK